jgi:hypothetical protein
MSMVTIFTQQLVRSVFVGAYFVRAMVAREQAEMLALGGIRIAMAQLLPPRVKRKAAKLTEQEQKKKDQAAFLQAVLPHLNRWQDFILEESIDGIDGQIRICICSEDGKINLNEAFDFKKGEFDKEIAFMLKKLAMKGKLAQGVLLKKLTEFLKKRKKKLDDITELLNVDGFEGISLFYKPPKLPDKKKRGEPNVTIALQDLFTLWRGKKEMEPMFFSDAMCAILGLRRPRANDSERIKEKFKQVIENFRADWGKDWEANWKHLQIIYDQKPALLKQIKGLLSQEFEPRVYSVLSCGKVAGVEQCLLAVIEKSEELQQERKQDKGKEEKAVSDRAKQEKPTKPPFKIQRIYWL